MRIMSLGKWQAILAAVLVFLGVTLTFWAALPAVGTVRIPLLFAWIPMLVGWTGFVIVLGASMGCLTFFFLYDGGITPEVKAELRALEERLAAPKPLAEAVPVPGSADDQGLVRCGGCRRRFFLHDAQRWDGERHLGCGQRIVLDDDCRRG